MVFLHGTALMHKNGLGKTREERIKQVIDGRDESLRDFCSYVPVEGIVQKLVKWQANGAEISYISSHRNPDDVAKDEAVLKCYGFPEGAVFFRRTGEGYGDVAKRVQPDIIVEDDCESLGA